MSQASRRSFLRQAAALGIGVSVAGTGLLAACAPASQPAATAAPGAPKPPAAQATSAPAQQAAPAQKATGITGTVKVSYPDEAGKKPPYVTAAAEAVQKAHQGAKVEIDHQKISSGDYYTKLLLALGAKEGPDVTHVGGDRIGEMADAGFLEPLDAYVAKWDEWKTYPDAVRQGVTYKGKVYGIPYGLDTRFLYYRKDVFEKAGLDPNWQPKGVNDILTAAKAVQAKVPNVIPYALYAGPAGDSGTANHAFVPTLWAFGGELQNKEGKWVGDSPALRKALAYYDQAYRKDKLVPGEVLTASKPWTAMREKMGTGELAILFEGGWTYGGFKSKEGVGYILYPTENAGPSFTVGGPGTVWMMTSQAKNKELAWEFIKTWNNRDTVAKLNIEDPHPVARTDSAETAEFKAQKFLVDSTESLKKARFTPVDAGWGKVITAIQQATNRVASGEGSVEDAAKRYTDDLKRALGDANVVSG